MQCTIVRFKNVFHNRFLGENMSKRKKNDDTKERNEKGKKERKKERRKTNKINLNKITICVYRAMSIGQLLIFKIIQKIVKDK